MITTQSETLAVALDGAKQADIRIEFGGGELTIGPATPGFLLSGEARDAVIEAAGAGHVRIHPHAPEADPLRWRPFDWRLGVTAEVPLDLALATGANRSVIDLSGIRVRRLSLETGASETRIRLPASGPSTVHVSCGFAQVTLEVPMDVEVRIHGRMVLGAIQVDEARFPRAAEGWASPEAATSAEAVDIEIEGGFGAVRVV